jgi:nicotinamide-nucleotide amidase
MDQQLDAISTLISSLSESLTARQWVLGVAESCTGGMLSEHFTAVAGSSAWFSCGFITYSNASKMQMLEVDEVALELFGAVSEEVASEMALGVLDNSDANITVSITGIAGPTGGTELKPVGMVCFAWALENQEPVTATEYFHGDRQAIRQQATLHAIKGLISHLRNQAS